MKHKSSDQINSSVKYKYMWPEPRIEGNVSFLSLV